MSASPQRFNFVPQNTKPDTQLPADAQLRESEILAQLEETAQVNKSWRLYSALAMLLAFVGGVLAGYFVYLLWEQVSLHESQIARQQVTIQRLTANGAAVSNQVSRLSALDSRVGSLQSQFELHSEKLAELENSQIAMRDQIAAINGRWQREIRELRKAKAPISTAPSTAAVASSTKNPAPPAANPPAAASQQPSAEKHNETFSPDLKPTPNSYAEMSPSGLVVWMTPRPGFAKPVPTSVIGHVRGLGMLVHDWDDNNHYFITESGSWIPDQR